MSGPDENDNDSFDWDEALDAWEKGLPTDAAGKRGAKKAAAEGATAGPGAPRTQIRPEALAPPLTPVAGATVPLRTVPAAAAARRPLPATVSRAPVPAAGPKPPVKTAPMAQPPPATVATPVSKVPLKPLLGKAHRESKPFPTPIGLPPAVSARPAARSADRPRAPSVSDDDSIDISIDVDVSVPVRRTLHESSDPDRSVITSASELDLSIYGSEEPLKLPSARQDEAVLDGNMYDPFADPAAARSEQPTMAPPPGAPVGSRPKPRAPVDRTSDADLATKTYDLRNLAAELEGGGGAVGDEDVEDVDDVDDDESVFDAGEVSVEPASSSSMPIAVEAAWLEAPKKPGGAPGRDMPQGKAPSVRPRQTSIREPAMAVKGAAARGIDPPARQISKAPNVPPSREADDKAAAKLPMRAPLGSTAGMGRGSPRTSEVSIDVDVDFDAPSESLKVAEARLPSPAKLPDLAATRVAPTASGRVAPTASATRAAPASPGAALAQPLSPPLPLGGFAAEENGDPSNATAELVLGILGPSVPSIAPPPRRSAATTEAAFFDSLEEHSEAHLESRSSLASLDEGLEDEKPSSFWLTDTAREAFESRSEWLEAEARRDADKAGRARGLLAASELRALTGDRERAAELAEEAVEISQGLVLGHVQARALRTETAAAAQVDALEAFVKVAASPAAKLHGLLLANDIGRTLDQDEGIKRRIEGAGRIAPLDARVVLGRAVYALLHDEVSQPNFRPPDGEKAGPLGRAFAALVRLRTERGAPTGPVPPEIAIVDALKKARSAYEKRDVRKIVEAFSEMTVAPELRESAHWLVATFGAQSEETRSLAIAASRHLEGDSARRMAVTRAVEKGDAVILATALSDESVLGPIERLAIAMLAGRDREAMALVPPALDDPAGLVLAAAITTLLPSSSKPSSRHGPATEPMDHDEILPTGPSASAIRVARLLVRRADPDVMGPALRALEDSDPATARALELELARRKENWAGVSAAFASDLEGPSDESSAARTKAAALLLEGVGAHDDALALYRQAFDLAPEDESLLRILIDRDSSFPVGLGLAAFADRRGDDFPAALARAEAQIRAPAAEAAELDLELERSHAIAPSFPLAAFVGEVAARRRGDVDRGLLWMQSARTGDDPIENALAEVREALLLATSDPAAAEARLEKAHLAAPHDFALREFYERVAGGADDRASWRESQAKSTTGPVRTTLLLEAAHEHERRGDLHAALKAARAGSNDPDGLLGIVLERLELATGDVGRLADDLLGRARDTEDLTLRREAYERLAELDARGRGDTSTAMLWHRTIIGESPEYLPSLRYLEHALAEEGRDEELEPIALTLAHVLSAEGGSEAHAHAWLVARLRARGGDWDGTKEMADVAWRSKTPPLWALRLKNAHARVSGDPGAILATTLPITDKTTRSMELAALLLRAAESAVAIGKLGDAKSHLEKATAEDPGDVVAWKLFASVKKQLGDPKGAAEAYEALARTSYVQEHQAAAWYEAGCLWTEGRDTDESRGTLAFEQTVRIDPHYKDAFDRLVRGYELSGAKNELAELLERRLAGDVANDERVKLTVSRGRLLMSLGDREGARRSFDDALRADEDNVEALGQSAALAEEAEDWVAAEAAWVRLARLVADEAGQRALYEKLGHVYSTHLLNLSRAEQAFREVLKRAPVDLPTMERLVEIYVRQNDATRAIEVQTQLVTKAKGLDRRTRLLELARLHETVARDTRKAEQTLETARRDAPHDAGVLRALAEFYTRHRQQPAVQMLLERAAGDTRRSLAGGRFQAPLFETLATVYELRGRPDAARVIRGTLAVLTSEPVDLPGAEVGAGDPRLDETLAPEALSPSLRALLVRTGTALDALVPVDLRAMRAVALPPQEASLYGEITTLAGGMRLQGVQVFVSSQLGPVAVPVSSSPPALVIGEPLLRIPNLRARQFSLVRALKLIQANASALLRAGPKDLPMVVGAWLQALNPGWQAPGLSPGALAEPTRRIAASLPRTGDPDIAMLARDVADRSGTQPQLLGPAAIAWANRVALLSIGDPNAALDGLAWSVGLAQGAPVKPAERATWIVRTVDAKELITFSVSDAYFDVRSRVGLAR